MLAKSLVFVALILICANSLHFQKFAPSTPGGRYQGANGTASSGSSTYPNYNYNTNTNTNYNRPNSYPGYNTNTNSNTYPNYNTNTNSNTYPNYNTNTNTNYNRPNSYPGYNTNTNTNTKAVYVNGKPYVYTGPFTLVCYVNNQVYKYDSCSNATTCGNIINDYSNCKGTVKKYSQKPTNI